MAGYTIGGTPSNDGPRSENIGNVTLKIESFDHATNSATGVTRDGEAMTIRLANKAEFADMFVNRNVHTTEDARNRLATKQTGNRPDTSALQVKMDEGEGSIQFQSVRKMPDGQLVARWMESVATTAEDSYVNAMVRIPIPRTNAETAGDMERRRADVVMVDSSTAATMASLNEFTLNRVPGDDGKQLDAASRGAVLVAIQSVDDPSDTSATLVWTGWDSDAKRPVDGGRALFDRPLNEFNFEHMVALAAQVGVPFDDLKFDNQRVNADSRTAVAALYDETQKGNFKVAIAPGFSAETMPRLTESVVKAEKNAAESEGRQAMMSNRGFFPADIGIRLREGSDGFPDQIAVKQILPNEILAPKASDAYSPRSIAALGAQVIATAEAKGLDLTVKPAPEPAPQQEPAPAPTNKPGVSMTPGM